MKGAITDYWNIQKSRPQSVHPWLNPLGLLLLRVFALTFSSGQRLLLRLQHMFDCIFAQPKHLAQLHVGERRFVLAQIFTLNPANWAIFRWRSSKVTK